MSSSSPNHQKTPETSVSDHFGQLSLTRINRPWFTSFFYSAPDPERESAVSEASEPAICDSNPSGRPTNPKVFRDGRAARPSDVFIALMGVTGSGKSTFISLCSHKAAKAGHDLRACTTDVDVYVYELSASRTVYLIDTPGFDDTSRSDTDVLREIAGWLTASYSNKVLLHGIIYLHRITDVRMQGSAMKNLLMFKKLCGDNALRKVVLTTTMWDKVPPREAEDREQQLINTPNFWGLMVSKGSTVYRHNNTVKSAIRIIEELARGNSTVTLDLQNQMVNQNQTLRETSAGRELESELIKEREKWAAELKDAQEQMKEAIRVRDQESEQALREVKDDYTTRIERLERDHKRLHIDTERLRNARIERLEEALEKQNKAHADKLEELKQENVKLQETNQKIIEESPLMPTPISWPMFKSSYSRGYHDTDWFFASLHADNWTLIGPKTSIAWHPQISIVSREEAYDQCFLVWGTNNSFVYKYRKADGTRKIKISTNLNVEYPRLYETLRKSDAQPLWICLGPKQFFYVKWKYRFNYWLPIHIVSKINEAEDDGEITAVALGKDDSYVIIRERGWEWDLKGHYGALSDNLKTSRSAPRLVALNFYNTTDFLLLKDFMGYDLTRIFGKENFGSFREWRDKNGVQKRI